ncbi:MAG: Na+/H+ antiporter NhaA [Chloroflexi bacterium]|nr:Na+/H+ antiporter NhaA [Chloroflexota bacterium]
MTTESRPRRARVEPVDLLVRPFQSFARLEASSGLLLIFATVAALALANSGWSERYHDLWELKLAIGTPGTALNRPIHFWINDGLMAFFFLVVGLEIKRELLVGELASPRRAALPMIAAAGGMAIPAVVYFLFNAGTETARGWAIPVATDIAFALGVLALLGSRVPVAMKAFLTALAIADDIGGVIVIALFFTETLVWTGLLAAGAVFLVLILAGRLGIRSPLVYGALGVLLWFALLRSGVHATLAGVLVAFTIPARTRIESDEFIESGRNLLDHFERSSVPERTVLSNQEQHDAIESLERACEQAETPLQRIERQLHPWVVFAIIPLFAFANAGVSLGGDFAGSLLEPVTLGVMFGLMIGKPVGITLAVWFAVKARLAALPSGIGMVQIHGVAWLGGIGFTLAIFIAELALVDEAHLAQAKVGILAGSLLAGIVGTLVLLAVTRRPHRPQEGVPAVAAAR